MISRRLVRIKAMQTYYAFLQDGGEQNISTLTKELEHNINQSYRLFIHLHCLLSAVFDFATERIEIGRNKHIKTDADINPNTKFTDNRIIANLHKDIRIAKALTDKNFNWKEYPEFVKSLYLQITNSQYYRDYMAEKTSSISQDFDILNKIISKTIIYNEQLEEILEEQSIYWNDDLEFLCSNMIQNFKKYNDKTIENFRIPAVFKNDEDEEFSYTLIKLTALHHKEFDQIVLDSLKKWELDRIAFVDRVILHLALAEITQMPDMPVKVTINEYLDIAKFYSTEKSSVFINGILDKVYSELKNAGALNKSGLGMVE
ncbi:MAG: transcription antitermination factor NusB [Bacteroidales bacterium]|nr:transcription antitermination factor NusB [Bacteroidales bacterium]